MANSLTITQYVAPFLLAFTLSVLFTYLVRRMAVHHNVVDLPEQAPERKIHRTPAPLLGGIAIFLSVVMVTSYYAFFTDRLIGGYLKPKYLVGMLIAGLLLMVGGWLDDRYHLRPGRQIIWPMAACLAVIASGIGITYISNPFGGVFQLDTLKLAVFSAHSIPYYFVVFADIFAFLWMMGMMYTTKFLDGLDGLVSGITTIGAVVIFLLSLNKEVAQPETALLSIVLAGAALGFLIFNFHPAKIFLGEGGSLFTGFMLGTLSIISGGKIATAILIMGIPILDVLWVIVRRMFFERRSPFSTADKKHLHYRLMDVGLSHRQAVLLLYLVSLGFGGSALFLEGEQKMVALIVLISAMVVIASVVMLKYRKLNTRP